MTDLSDTFIRALPDLTLVVRRDGLVMSNLGGREIGVPTEPGALCGKKLQDLWPDTIATGLTRLVKRVLKERAPADGSFQHSDKYLDVRAQPQGIDRALLIVRVTTGASQAAANPSLTHILGASAPGDCTAFAAKFCEAIANARLRETQVALAIVHFDDLSQIKATFGEPVAQMLMASILERITALLSSAPAQRKPFRTTQLESDQLAVLIENIPSRMAAAQTAEEMWRAVAKPIELDGRRHKLNPIVGLALFPADGQEPETLLDCARGAILEAHRSGQRNPVATCTDSPMPESVSQADLERELRWAVERDQFSIVYAPIVELSGQRTVSIAASLRWTHSMCGPVPEEQFMPLLAALNLRAQLDRWILRCGFRDLATLPRHDDARISLCVKLTPQTLDGATVITDITDAARAAEVALSRLDIDIDVRTVAAGSRVRGYLRELRKLGVRIFLDNFGRDGIPLARLSSLPLDGVKIAPEFVTRLEHDPSARAVYNSAVATARAFGFKCIATGVSQDTDLSYLHECGCEQATGPLFGAPRPVREIPDAAALHMT